MANTYQTSIRDDEYVARVIRHKPSSLLPIIARTGAQYKDLNSWLNSPYKKYTPWALADISRVSLVSGNEYRADATQDDLLQCAAAYVQINDPELDGHKPASVTTFMLRITAEQLPFQRNPYNELGRTVALLEQTPALRPPKVLNKGWEVCLLGCTLSQYVGVGFLVHTAAVKNNGLVTTEWFKGPALDKITADLPAQLIDDVLARNFVANPDWFRKSRPAKRSDDYRRFSFNPLVSKPVVSGIITDRMLVPVVGQIFRKISPLGIYYSGVEKWGNDFADDVGDVFEQYIGRQLRQVQGATVHSEVVYDKGGKKSVDWIVVCDDYVILVEVKSVRPTEAVRMGTPNASIELKRMLGHAYSQLNKSDNLIGAQHPDFDHIPGDRPRLGIIVTMEQFAIANVRSIRELHEPPNIPTTVCSAEDIEQLVTMQGESIGTFIANFMDDPANEGASIASGMQGKTLSRNAVLDEAWAAYTWGIPPGQPGYQATTP